MSIRILDPNLGVERVLEFETSEIHLPQARPLAQGEIGDGGLEKLFALPTVQNMIDRHLRPEIPDEEMLRPDILNRNLASALETLQGSGQPAIRRFVRDDLGPLMEDTQLLKTYSGLMIDG